MVILLLESPVSCFDHGNPLQLGNAARSSRLAARGSLRPEDADQFRDMLTNSTMKLGTPGERCGENREKDMGLFKKKG